MVVLELVYLVDFYLTFFNSEQYWAQRHARLLPSWWGPSLETSTPKRLLTNQHWRPSNSHHPTRQGLKQLSKQPMDKKSWLPCTCPGWDQDAPHIQCQRPWVQKIPKLAAINATIVDKTKGRELLKLQEEQKTLCQEYGVQEASNDCGVTVIE